MNDKVITLYNYIKKSKTYQRIVIRGVEYSYSGVKSVIDGKISFDQLLTVVIPVEADADGREYIDFAKFQKAENQELYWTINPKNNQDVIVCGECAAEVTKDYTISSLLEDNVKAGKVASFSDNTEGALLKHYKVVCK